MAGSDRTSYHPDCGVVALLLQYSLLAAFMVSALVRLVMVIIILIVVVVIVVVVGIAVKVAAAVMVVMAVKAVVV